MQNGRSTMCALRRAMSRPTFRPKEWGCSAGLVLSAKSGRSAIGKPISSMDRESIVAAIRKAQKRIAQYIELVDLFGATDVSIDNHFQRLFNLFYHVRHKTGIWHKTYYFYMQQQKGNAPDFSTVLRYFASKMGRYEPSFSSKLIAIHNPTLPIWDSVVLNNTGITAPWYSDPQRLYKAEKKYRQIQVWYFNYLRSNEGKAIVELFNENIREHAGISDIRKLDFVLWQ